MLRKNWIYLYITHYIIFHNIIFLGFKYHRDSDIANLKKKIDRKK